MKRSILSLLVAGMFAGIASSATAQIVTAGGQPGMDADRQSNPAKSDVTADAALKAQYAAAKKLVQNEFKATKANRESLSADATGQCMTDAKAARTETLAQAKTQWENQIEMDGKSAAKPTKGDLGNASAEPKYAK